MAAAAVLALSGVGAAAALATALWPPARPPSATRSAADFRAGIAAAARGVMVVFNGPSSAGKSTLVKSVQQRLVSRGGAPLAPDSVFLRVAYDDLDVLLPENALPDLFVWEDNTPRLRQPHEAGGPGGKGPGEVGFNGPDETAVYWFEDRTGACLPSRTTPAMAIVNGPSADACLRGQHRAWTAMCAAGNSLLVDHWLQVTPTPRLSSPFCCPLSPAAFARRSRGGWTTCRRHLRSSLPGLCISSTWTASWGSWRGVSPRAATVCWGRHAGAASTAALSGTASGAPQGATEGWTTA